MGSTVFRNPRALSSALAALGTLQPRALGFLNTVDPLDTVSNCYIVCGGCLPRDELVEALSGRSWLHATRSCDVINKLLLLFRAGLWKTEGRKRGRKGEREGAREEGRRERREGERGRGREEEGARERKKRRWR